MQLKTVSPLVAALVLGACKTSDTSVSYDGYPTDADHWRAAAEMDELALPGAEHAALVNRVGTWDVAIKLRFSADDEWHEESGVSTYETLLDGRYLLEKLEVTLGGKPYEGVQILGYSNLDYRYVSVSLDSMSTWPMEASGTVDAAGKIHLVGQLRDVITPHGRRYVTIETPVSDDEFLTEAFDTIDGELVKIMEIRRTRRR